jgi:putative transposase
VNGAGRRKAVGWAKAPLRRAHQQGLTARRVETFWWARHRARIRAPDGFAHPTAASQPLSASALLHGTHHARKIELAMSHYRRARIDGSIFFFTVVLADRKTNLLVNEIQRLRQCYRSVRLRRPFETIAICVLPDHLHALWALPAGDADFSTRWSLIKSGFSRGLDPAFSRSASKTIKREKGIWQRRYWEHAIRNDADLERHADYIHFNPVKHGYVTRVSDWPHSSFHRYVDRGWLPADWGGDVREIEGSFGE